MDAVSARYTFPKEVIVWSILMKKLIRSTISNWIPITHWQFKRVIIEADVEVELHINVGEHVFRYKK